MNSKNRKPLMLFIILITLFRIGNAQTIARITMQPVKVIYIADTAVTTDNISPKMAKGYGSLFRLIGQQQLISGKTMAIYHTASAPWIFDIAVEVDKMPQQLTGVIQFKTLEGGEAVVVHFKGPYEQIDKAYLQMEEWLKKNKKKRVGPTMEVYLNDPSTVKDKNELLTDIYQLIK